MIILMIDTGMRLGECCILMVSDLNLAKRQILLRSETTKGRKDRTVYFSQKAESVLRRWLQYKDRYVESDFVFPAKYSGRSIQVSNFETNFKGYLRRAGLNESYSPCCLRNNFAKPNQVWCTDFTYLYLSNGALRFNCTIIDLYDRSVVASEMGHYITSELAIATISKTLVILGKAPEGLILHSYQGSQYTSLEFITFCKEHGILQSMSKAGFPYDNAPMERYYNSLKHELINRYYFRTDDELNFAVAEYAYGWYNHLRSHAHNGYLTPFEARYSPELIRWWCYKFA